MTQRPTILILLLSASLSVSACTQFPELDQTITPEMNHTDYPALVPLQPLLAHATANRLNPAQTEAALLGRLARLRARAARLRGSVLTGDEHQRLAQGLH